MFLVSYIIVSIAEIFSIGGFITNITVVKVSKGKEKNRHPTHLSPSTHSLAQFLIKISFFSGSRPSTLEP